MKTYVKHNAVARLHEALTQSTHEWIYCFLERGGDAGEVYLSPSQLLMDSERLARVLMQKVPENTGVVIALAHGPAFLIALLACFLAKRPVITAPLPRFGASTARVKSICELCDDAFILCQTQSVTTFQTILSDIPSFTDNKFLCVDVLLQQRAEAPLTALPGLTASLDTTVVIQFTSGSTRQPKGVVITAGNIAANQHRVGTRWNFHKEKTMLTWLPYFHDMGLFGGIIYPLMCGLRIVQMDPLHFVQKPQRWLKAADRFKANFTGGPAFAYELCNELPDSKIPHDVDLSHWEVAYCGADYVPEHTMATFRKKFTPYKFRPHSLVPVYGLAEATLFVAGQPNPNAAEFPLYAGNNTEGCYMGEHGHHRIEIRAQDHDQVLPEGDIGEICFIGDSVSPHYYPMPDSAHHGVLRTGDLGFVKNGYLFVSGRIKDILVINSVNMSPSTVEQLAASVHHSLNPHAIAAFQPFVDKEDVVLLIEVKTHTKLTVAERRSLLAEITHLIQQKTGISLAQVQLVKRGELMRTSSGKVQRKLVAEYFCKGYTFKEVPYADA